jgi:hypothetical protein
LYAHPKEIFKIQLNQFLIGQLAIHKFFEMIQLLNGLDIYDLNNSVLQMKRKSHVLEKSLFFVAERKILMTDDRAFHTLCMN